MKKTLSAILAVLLAALLCACVSKTVENTSSPEPTATAEATATPSPTATPTAEPTPEATPTIPQLQLGDTIDLDFLKMTIDNISIEDEIYPFDTSGAYLYISDVDGSQYVCLCGVITNLSSSDLDSRYFMSKVTINDEYSYDAELCIGSNPNAITDYALEPLGSAHYYLYASVPDTAVNIMEKGTISLAFNDGFARSDGNYSYTYTIDFTK